MTAASDPNPDRPDGSGDVDLMAGFDPVREAQWMDAVATTLSGGAAADQKVAEARVRRGRALIEGVVLPRLASADRPTDRVPHQPGMRAEWDVRQAYADPSLETVAAAIADDRGHGVTSGLVRLDRIAEALEDLGIDGNTALGALDVDALRALAGEHPGHLASTAFDAGPAAVAVTALQVAALQVAAARASGVDTPGRFDLAHVDPLRTLAGTGELPESLAAAYDQMGMLTAWATARLPGRTVVEVATTPYHDAGCHDVDQLAIALATAAAYLRALAERGVSPPQASPTFAFRLALDPDLYRAIAMLRALRRLWARVLEACGVPADDAGERDTRVHAVSGERWLTARDPWGNLLRGTTVAAAAAIGGADSITILPFDHVLGDGRTDAFARRLARNTQLVLDEEAHIGRVVDPAAGAYLFEQLTDDLARAAWARFQQIESRGGIEAVLADGSLAAEVGRTAHERAQQVATRQLPIVGVSRYVDLDEAPVVRVRPSVDVVRAEFVARDRAAKSRGKTDRKTRDAALTELRRVGGKQADAAAARVHRVEVAISAAQAGASLAELVEALGMATEEAEGDATIPTAFGLRRLAEPFEQLRDHADAAPTPPTVHLATIGPATVHGSRRQFTTDLAAAGGFRTTSGVAETSSDEVVRAWHAAGAMPVVVICSSDATYAEHAESLARALKHAGAFHVALAGAPTPERRAELQAAGIDGFVHVGCNALETLLTWQRALSLSPKRVPEGTSRPGVAAAVPAAREAPSS